jgi:hypothetical protein
MADAQTLWRRGRGRVGIGLGSALLAAIVLTVIALLRRESEGLGRRSWTGRMQPIGRSLLPLDAVRDAEFDNAWPTILVLDDVEPLLLPDPYQATLLCDPTATKHVA